MKTKITIGSKWVPNHRSLVDCPYFMSVTNHMSVTKKEDIQVGSVWATKSTLPQQRGDILVVTKVESSMIYYEYTFGPDYIGNSYKAGQTVDWSCSIGRFLAECIPVSRLHNLEIALEKMKERF